MKFNKNDVRIGNYILDGGGIVKVQWTELRLLHEGKLKPNGIRLTHEILMPLFKFDIDGFYHIVDDDILMDDDFNLFVQGGDNVLTNIGVKQNAVHQFQNWYYFNTGSELEINLTP
jgi:hypothetical protein